MKIGILTFHCAHNYGAVLQCFSLQEYLRTLGHEVFVIDYRPEYLNRVYPKNSIRLWVSKTLLSTIKKIKYELKVHKTRKKRYDNFENFINSYLRLAPYTKGMSFNDYDLLFIGSDQIWDKEICGGQFDPLYFGINVDCPVVPYAPSNKISFLNENEKLFFEKALKQYPFISVREQKLLEVLQPLTPKKIHHVVDPTLLANDILIKKIKNERKVKDKYVLIYEIIEHPEVIEQAKTFAKKHGYKVVMLSAYLMDSNLDYRDQSASPEDFVNYIRNAEYVFTTSFHGTAISIICKTNFVSFRQNTSSDIRIQSLLDSLGLLDRFIEMEDIIPNNNIDYDGLDPILHKEIYKSRQFVNDCVSEINNVI